MKKFETIGKGELRECPEESGASQAVLPVIPPPPRDLEAQAGSPVQAEAVPSVTSRPEMAASIREAVPASSAPNGDGPQNPGF